MANRGVCYELPPVTRAPLATLLAAAALAVAPASSLAQDAGGGQYIDPLAPGHHSGSGPGPGATASASSPGTSGAGASAGSSSSSSSGSPSSAKAAGTGTIPRTGFPVGVLMFAGGLLLSSGLALRRLKY